MEWKKYLRRPEGAAAASAFLCGLLVHCFGLVNMLHNYDNIIVNPQGYGTGVSSGRWFLTIVGDAVQKIVGNYNMTWFNGVMFIALAALSAAVFVGTLRVPTSSTTCAVLVGMLFAAFPTATSALLFTFLSAYHGLALLLSVVAAWALLRGRAVGFAASILCIAMSMGIYQAYVPVTVSVVVLTLLVQMLTEDVTFMQMLRKGLYCCLNIALGVAAYFVFLRLCLNHYQVELSTYQNINTMGQLSIGQLPGLIVRAVKLFCLLPLRDYCTLAPIPLLKAGYLLAGVESAVLIVLQLIRGRKKLPQIIMTGLLCAAFPVAVNLIVIMCPNSYIYTMMVYAFVVALCMPLVLCETLPDMLHGKKVIRRIAVFTAAAVVFGNAYVANVNYTGLYYANRQTENYLNAMVAQVRMTEGYDSEKEWAFVGDNVRDPALSNGWNNAIRGGGNSTAGGLINAYSREAWIEFFLGCRFPMAWPETVEALKTNEEVLQMPCWPAQGSIKVIGDQVVIKLEQP